MTGPAYHQWQHDRVVIAGRRYTVATKPGLAYHGLPDPGTEMLAEGILPCAGLVVVSMPCGNGLIGAVAAANGAAQVYMSDRHSLAVQAAQRTLDANELSGAIIGAGQGTCALAFSVGGTAARPGEVKADIVAIRVVPEALTMRQLLLDARATLRTGGRCYVAGANEEGAKSAARVLEQLFGNVRLLAQRRGHRLVMAELPATLPPVPDAVATAFVDPQLFHRVPVELSGRLVQLHTRPGVFSWQHLDEASALLLQEMVIAPDARVLDLGCGAGVLGIAAALQSPTARITLVDVDSESVRCVNATIQSLGLTNATARVSDVAAAVIDASFDVVISNPPFHVGKHTDLTVPRQFIRDAFHVLRTGGTLMLVANRTLPYEQDMKARFGAVETLHDGRRFKVLSATKS